MQIIRDKEDVKERARQTLTVLFGLLGFILFCVGLSSEGRFYHYLLSFISIGLLIYSRKLLKASPVSNSGHRDIDHGSATWSKLEDLEKVGLQWNEPGGLWVGDGLINTKQGHLLTIAGARQGKGTTLIIPALLIEPHGSFVVTDPKGENACITARAQKQYGQQVYILDPWDEQTKIGATHGIPSAGFNPFDFIKQNSEELRDNCENIASLLVPDKPDVKDPFWNDRARTLIKAFLMHIITSRPEEEHNFWTLYKMLRLSGEAWLTLLLEMKDSEALDGLVSIVAEEFIGFDPAGSTLVGIKSTAQNATTMFESPQIRKSLEKSDFNPYDLAKGKCTVYIDIPERYLETHSGWLRLVIGLCLKACNAKPDKKVYFLLDEFPVMGKMLDVIRGYAFAAGQNIVLWTFSQSLSQLKQIYGEDGMNIMISNAQIFQCFGVKDQFTTQYVSKMLGDATYSKTVKSFSSGQSGGSTSTSHQTFGRPLFTPEEVERSKRMIMIVHGLKVLIPRATYFSNRFDGLDPNDKELAPDIRQKLKAGEVIQDWREVFAKLADPRPRAEGNLQTV